MDYAKLTRLRNALLVEAGKPGDQRCPLYDQTLALYNAHMALKDGHDNLNGKVNEIARTLHLLTGGY